MMLAALKLTFSPSIESASCLAISSQWSARAGEAAKVARSANAAASNVERRNCRRDVMCEGPFGAALKRMGRESARAQCRLLRVQARALQISHRVTVPMPTTDRALGA